MEYTEKFVFHLPQYAWKDGRLVEIDHPQFKNLLLSDLAAWGVESSYSILAEGSYRGRTYPEELLTVYCTPDSAQAIEAIFRKLCLQNNPWLMQEAFAYEHQGKLIVFSSSDS